MTSPIQAATIAALSSDRCCWKEATFNDGLQHSRRFVRAYRRVQEARATTLKDLQCKARLILLTSDDPTSMEDSLAHDVLAYVGAKA
ncbi:MULTISPECIES: hypothetical protein [Acetobacter]|uniref:hypothetical protein n=1 Tax=Acetobacter TaxID=434 RepID=UPI00242CC28A|nr:hypothetical protein [Acetobacter syzygii]